MTSLLWSLLSHTPLFLPVSQNTTPFLSFFKNFSPRGPCFTSVVVSEDFWPRHCQRHPVAHKSHHAAYLPGVRPSSSLLTSHPLLQYHLPSRPYQWSGATSQERYWFFSSSPYPDAPAPFLEHSPSIFLCLFFTHLSKMQGFPRIQKTGIPLFPPHHSIVTGHSLLSDATDFRLSGFPLSYPTFLLLRHISPPSLPFFSPVSPSLTISNHSLLVFVVNSGGGWGSYTQLAPLFRLYCHEVLWLFHPSSIIYKYIQGDSLRICCIGGGDPETPGQITDVCCPRTPCPTISFHWGVPGRSWAMIPQ